MARKETPKKECPICGDVCNASQLMCRNCWLNKVPRHLRLIVYPALAKRTVTNDSEAWKAWAKAAYDAVFAVNPNATNLHELAELAGIKIKEKEAV